MRRDEASAAVLEVEEGLVSQIHVLHVLSWHVMLEGNALDAALCHALGWHAGLLRGNLCRVYRYVLAVN